MHPLERKILRLIVENNIIDQDEKWVIGVSGGADSITLLNILANLASDLKIKMIATYLDHGLRPDESTAECDLVRRESEKNGAHFEHGVVDTRSFARRAGVSVEDASRQLRYEYFREIMKKHHAKKVAVAHNADDQAEEVLLRLIRGSGRKGLSGMDLIRDCWLVRPLLAVTREDILDYLQSKNLIFCHDSSNNDLSYLRNRVRLELLPYLAEQYNSGIKKVLRQTATIFDDEEQLLDTLAAKAHSNSVTGSNPSHIFLPKFLTEKKAIQRRIIEKVLLGLSGQPGFRQIEQILCLAKAREDGGQIHLARGLRGIVKEDLLIFSYPAGGSHSATFEVEIDAPGDYSLSDGRVVRVEYRKKAPRIQEIRQAGEDWFDVSQLSFPFKCRNRGPGDRFHPLGSPGSKTVGDFLGDTKVPKDQRSRVIILEKGRQIAALLGLRIDHGFRVRSSTVAAVRIIVKPPQNAN